MNNRAVTFLGRIKRTLLTSSILFFVVASNSLAGTFMLPDTGQTTCYDGAGNVIACPVPDQPLSQDGSYSINPLSYTDNGDGTVTDNNTGLVWQKNGDTNTYNWYQASGTYDAIYNPTSQNVCGSLSLGGYEDWRLPTKKELISIVDYSIPYPGPTINRTYFPNINASRYWSSTTVANILGVSWGVEFSYGGVYGSGKHWSGDYVQCVRGGQASPSLTDNSNGTVTDNKTGLIWQQSEPGYMTWDSALSYCEGLSVGDHSDWRLPNIKELESLTDDTRSNPSIDTNFFPNVYAGYYYWSSTTYTYEPYRAWGVEFTIGNIGGNVKAGYGYYPVVRCVRGGEAPETDRFAWPIDYPLGIEEYQEILSNGHYGRCGEWPGDPEGCFWLDDASATQRSVWRDVQPFQKHYWKFKNISGRHLGADYNIRSGDLDKGQFVYAVGKGVISKVESVPSWGNIIYIKHDTSFGTYISMYAHVDFLESGAPAENTPVELGTPIARVGKGAYQVCDRRGRCRIIPGTWPAHLHFEIRERENTDHGIGYTRCKNAYDTSAGCVMAVGPQGQIDPNAFIASHR